MTKNVAELNKVLSFLVKKKQVCTPTYIHNKLKDTSKKAKNTFDSFSEV